MAAGLAIIFACGMLWLSFLAPQLGLRGAAAAGFIPIVPADILKVFVAAAVLPAAWRITRAGNYRT
jgi:biotin transport system substrate-specific component